MSSTTVEYKQELYRQALGDLDTELPHTSEAQKRRVARTIVALTQEEAEAVERTREAEAGLADASTVVDGRGATYTGQERPITELEAREQSLGRRSDSDVARIVIDSDVKTAMSQFLVKVAGIPLEFSGAPKDAEARIRAQLEAHHDDTLRQDLLAFAADEDATLKALEARVAASRRPPTAMDDTHALILFRLFEGRTLMHLVKAYEAEPGDPTLIALVERDDADLERLFRLKADQSDVKAVRRLQAAREARQTAREDAKARTELEALRARRKAPRFLLNHLVREARAGRRIEVARLSRAR